MGLYVIPVYLNTQAWCLWYMYQTICVQLQIGLKTVIIFLFRYQHLYEIGIANTTQNFRVGKIHDGTSA